MKYQQRYVLAVSTLLALSSPVIGFATVKPPATPSPTTDSAQRSAVLRKDWAAVLNKDPEGSQSVALHSFGRNYNDDNNDSNLSDDWRDLKRAAGNIVRHAGGKVLDFVEEGGTKLLNLVGQGADKIKTALLGTTEQEQSTPVTTEEQRSSSSRSSPISPFMMDTEDEDLFRGIFGEGLFPTTSVSRSTDRVIEQAASILNKDNTVASLLGPNLRYGRPFSQSSRTTSINGRTSSTVQASFEVWGSQGEGVASVMSSDDKLLSLDVEIDNRLYRFNVSSRGGGGGGSGSSGSSPQPNAGSSTRRNYHVGYDSSNIQGDLDVEIMDGVRKNPNGGIMDAEIEGKTFL